MQEWIIRQIHKNFADFIDKYEIKDLYSGGFYPFKTLEEKWAFWARHIYQNRYEIGSTKVYEKLFQYFKDKNYYVLSTNVDGQFTKSGFPHNKVFEAQGDYCYFQCEKPCCQKLYYNEMTVRELVANVKDCRIPTEMIPRCPVCGRYMEYNLRVDNRFVQDKNWYRHNKDYEAFIKKSVGKRTVFLEMGVGFNTPGIIKYPFWQMTMQNPKATYVCMNLNEAVCPDDIKKQSICISNNIRDILEDIYRVQ